MSGVGQLTPYRIIIEYRKSALSKGRSNDIFLQITTARTSALQLIQKYACDLVTGYTQMSTSVVPSSVINLTIEHSKQSLIQFPLGAPKCIFTNKFASDSTKTL